MYYNIAAPCRFCAVISTRRTATERRWWWSNHHSRLARVCCVCRVEQCFAATLKILLRCNTNNCRKKPRDLFSRLLSSRPPFPQQRRTKERQAADTRAAIRELQSRSCTSELQRPRQDVRTGEVSPAAARPYGAESRRGVVVRLVSLL